MSVGVVTLVRASKTLKGLEHGRAHTLAAWSCRFRVDGRPVESPEPVDERRDLVDQRTVVRERPKGQG
ncbi:MAG: hypothetical protein ACRD1H_00715, partial [Vicinamibacterales bacterium]